MTISLSRRALALDFCHRRECAPAKYDHVKRETGPVKERAGVVPAFRSSVELRQIKTSRNK
jgi:hypothetical protein